jgi:drug/metabolite transporter (DMT)-like permease
LNPKRLTLFMQTKNLVLPNLLPTALVLGIAAVSTASTFVRFAQETTPSLVIAAGRLGLATLVLAPLALSRHRASLNQLKRSDFAIGLCAGVFLALHFWTWIASLERTSVVSSVVLVTTAPIWVALLSSRILKERVGLRTVAGLVLALAGGFIVACSGRSRWDGFSGSMAGDLLALAGAWMMAGYLLAGRSLRARLPLLPYLILVYGMAAAILSGACIAEGLNPFAASRQGWAWIVLLALVPQLLGHSIFNWALRRLPAAVVSIALPGEPVGSAMLAYFFLSEAPGVLEVAGSVLILSGIVIAARRPNYELRPTS